MKKTKILLPLLAFLSLLSCEKKQEPAGDFTYTLSQNFSPVEVTFIADYTDAETYSWDFGYNQTISGKTVTKTLTEGIHTVTLTVSGAGGETKNTKTINIPGKATKMKVTSIDVNNFPATNADGKTWDNDPGSNPDIFVIAGTEGDSEFAQSSNFHDDAISGKTYSFDIEYTFTKFDKGFFVNIYDIDAASYEFVGGLIGSMEYHRNNGYPDSFDMVLNEYSFTVHVVWE
ncbi:PKD domain-containing protein [Saccharicrinis sp. FJH2]|uniref:PKD domain-containing protein n=1 Tax=Saccharicrinis sp. FJH65 TaxID=3344659 RepID=UPI0035F3BD37